MVLTDTVVRLREAPVVIVHMVQEIWMCLRHDFHRITAALRKLWLENSLETANDDFIWVIVTVSRYILLWSLWLGSTAVTPTTSTSASLQQTVINRHNLVPCRHHWVPMISYCVLYKTQVRNSVPSDHSPHWTCPRRSAPDLYPSGACELVVD